MELHGSKWATAVSAPMLFAIAALACTAPRTANAQTANPSLYCFVSPNDAPGGPLGRCTSFFPSATYSAYFSVDNLPAGSYSYVWKSDLGTVLPCTTSSCTQKYRGDMPVYDVVSVTYTNLATGVSKTLSRAVSINGPI